MDDIVKWGAGIVITIVVSVIASLLAKKDAAQEKEIHALKEEHGKQLAELFRLHNDDFSRLIGLEIHVAKEHYIKPELDSRFDKLEVAFIKGFDSLGRKFDALADKLTR